LTAGDPITMKVRLSRDMDEDDEDDQTADAPYYPGKKLVNWWLVVGDAAKRALYGIKKVTVKQELTTKLQFTLPQGEHKLKLYLICDSYMGEWYFAADLDRKLTCFLSGADQDFDLETLKVAEGEDSDDDDDSDDAMEE
jgi:pre-mRNA-splicing helicase BRR2